VAGQPITSIPNPYGAPGSTLPESPPFAGNLSARYEFVFGDYRPFVQVGGQHPAHSHSATGYTVNYDQPGFTTYDAFAGAAKDAWTVQAYCSNFTDNPRCIVRRGNAIHKGDNSQPSTHYRSQNQL
jgi:hypothetical protein